jgi:hypothetical protein
VIHNLPGRERCCKVICISNELVMVIARLSLQLDVLLGHSAEAEGGSKQEQQMQQSHQ